MRNQKTLEKVDHAIKRLKRSKTKYINFKTVAEEAGVATATLYNNIQIKERIESLRALQKAEKEAEKQVKKNGKDGNVDITPTQARIEKMKAMHEEIKKLKEDKKNLIIQLVKMEEMKDENKKLREQLKKVISTVK
ncbi:transposase [bacterium LRH843]|nr:transposase [bacterium LRH843]